MRVATWNLERGGRTHAARRAQQEVLRELAADVLILTEPGPSFDAGLGSVTSPRLRANRAGRESWIAIVGASVEPATLAIPFERMAVAAITKSAERRFVVYGSVLPWNAFRTHAPDLIRDGESAEDSFLRVLNEQIDDIEMLRNQYPDHNVIWAGDFNQHLSGPHAGGSKTKREALKRALVELDLVAWNAKADHARPGLHAVDLICGSRDLEVTGQGRIDPVDDAVVMTDHAGYWVEL